MPQSPFETLACFEVYSATTAHKEQRLGLYVLAEDVGLCSKMGSSKDVYNVYSSRTRELVSSHSTLWRSNPPGLSLQSGRKVMVAYLQSRLRGCQKNRVPQYLSIHKAHSR